LNFNVSTAEKFSNYSLPLPVKNHNAKAVAVKTLKNYFLHIHLSLVRLPAVCRDPETRVVAAPTPIMRVAPDRVAAAVRFQLSVFRTSQFQNIPFYPISTSGSNFNPRNTQCIPVVKIFDFLEVEQKLLFFKGFMTVFSSKSPKTDQ
jgi:hypothetical protein